MSNRLELAALLHDVGRAIDPDNTEPHGFVGARFLDRIGSLQVRLFDATLRDVRRAQKLLGPRGGDC